MGSTALIPTKEFKARDVSSLQCSNQVWRRGQLTSYPISTRPVSQDIKQIEYETDQLSSSGVNVKNVTDFRSI
jgi:hypothetical protein